MARFSSLLVLALVFVATALATPLPSNSTELAELNERTLDTRSNHGTATFFYVGLGNCGGWNKDSDYIVALSTKMYNKGSHCNKKILITDLRTGKTATAQVRDSCPSCGVNDLDLSPSLFSHFENKSKGVFQMKWWFI